MPRTKRRIQNKLRGFQKRPVIQFGLLGNYEHVVEVPDRPDYVYIRFAGQVLSEVYNDRVSPLEDLQVIVGYDPEEPNLFQVLGTRPIRRYGEDDSTTTHLPEHHKTHEWMAQPDGGNDVVFSQLRQFMPLRVTPSEDTMDVFLHRGVVFAGKDYGWVYVSGGYVDLSSYAPTTGSLYALLSIDQNGLPDITIGETKDTLFLTLNDIPDPNVGCIPITALRLYGDQTNVVEAYSSTDVADLRFPGTRPFISLQDVPSSYTGSAGMAVFVRGDELGLEFAEVTADGLGGGGTGTFVNPMIYRGDMIYSDAGSIILENVADYNIHGTRATGSSVWSEVYTPANYVLKYLDGYNDDVDIWQSLVWTSAIGLGYSFDRAYVTIQLTGTYTLKGWSLRHSSTSSSLVKAGQYEVATWHTGTWVVQATHSPTELEEYVDFPSPVTTQFVRFRGIVSEQGLTTGAAWTIQNIGLYKYGIGQTPTRLPYGTVGQVLTSQNITGAVPRWNWLWGDVTGTYDALQVQGILGKKVHAEPGHPLSGDIIRFSTANNRWELVSGSSAGGGGASAFTDLTDTPSSYTNQARKFVRVNSVANALEFSNDITRWYNPLDYGGVGDGVTDDSMAISGTIAAIPASGGVLYFPPGYTWKTGGGHTLNKPIFVKGMGSANNFDSHYGISTVICSSGSAVLFNVTSYGCGFEDIFLMGVTGSTPTAGAGIRVLDGGDLMEFRGVTVHSFYIGIDMQDGASWNMNHCKFINTAKYGLKIQHVNFVDGGDQFVDNCWFWADGRTSDAAIRYESGGGLKISNTKIVGSGQSDKQFHYGIDMYLQPNVTTSILMVDNTSIENVDTNGIRAVTSPTGSSVFYDVQFSNLEIALNDKGAGSAAIYMSNQATGTLQYVTIDNIICFDWGDSITDEAIYLDGLAHVRVGAILRDGFSGDLATPNCIDVVYYVTGTSGGSGATTFLGLTDTPASYAGQAGKSVFVKGDESGLEFLTASSGSGISSSFVGARYTSDGSRILFSAGAEAPILLNKKVYDTHNAVTTGSSWRFYAPESGYYLIEGSLTLGAASWSTSQWAEWYVYKSGTTFGVDSLFNGEIKNGVGTTINMCVGGKSVVFLNAGEWITPYLYNTHSSNQYMITGTSATDFYSYISISKIANANSFSGAKVYNNANFAVSGSSVNVVVPFNSEYYDTDGYHTTGSTTINNSKLTIPISGYYEIGVQLKWQNSTTGIRELYLKKDGTTYIGLNTRPAPSAGTLAQSFTVEDYFTGGSYVQLEALHSISGNQNIEYADRYSPMFWIHKL